LGSRPFGIYIHVPFCATRCGYCDFNTYTAGELGGGAGAASFPAAAAAELRLAREVLGTRELPVTTVFVGGGTPTLLPPDELAALLKVVDSEFGLAPDVEITTEANPESVDATTLEQLRSAGYTRLSLGMQSARSHVLAVLERQHTPGRVEDAVGWARAAGFSQISLDLIYGSPGESSRDWQASLDAAIALAPDHVSAYALQVEDGTRLARRVRRGDLLAADDDLLADRYLQAEIALTAGGYRWYEVSNWARDEASTSRHNLGYWRSADWWGVGPGAHSHVGGVRWWNVRHPAAYTGLLDEGTSPAQAREVLDPQTRQVERVMLGLRLAEGIATDLLTAAGRTAAESKVASGLLEQGPFDAGRCVLTLRGRLLADAVVRDLLPD
jgi:oxygen-independent coproporphyrinogen-3 oxidase